jgi:hypothetical protein
MKQLSILFMRTTFRMLLFFPVINSMHTQGQTTAFPGALGFGANATGGRAGTVYHVTTLADSGPGSFRDAASVANRIIVFDVGGYITLKTAVSVKSNITIAGQTAPGGGIGFKGGEISFANSTNIICRYIRIRPGSETPSTGDDCLSFYRATNIIVDHCSVEFAPWNNIDGVSDDWQNHPVNNITVQYSLIANPTGQQFGAHTEAVNGTWAWFYNIFANSHNRNPLAKINSIFVNNVLYNCSAGYTTHTSTNFNHDIVNNYFIMGPASAGTDNQWFQIDKNQSIYYSGNLKDNNYDGVLNGATTTPYWYQGTGTVLTSPWSPLTTAATIYNTQTAYRLTASLAGTFPRDQMDSLIINQVKTLGQGTTGTGAGTTGPGSALYTSQAQTGLPNNGYGIINGGGASLDSEGDGMPDYWEQATGLNPGVNDAMTVAANGYTNLENFLNWLGDAHALTTTNTAVNIDLATYTSEFVNNSAAYALSNITNGTATLLADGHTVRFTPGNNYKGVASFHFSVNTADGSSYENDVSVAVSPIPGTPQSFINPPSAVTLTASTVETPSASSTIVINWTDNSDNEDYFVVERSTDGINYTDVNHPAANATTYTDNNLLPNTTYYYRIKAVNASTSSAYSTSVSIKTPPLPSSPTAAATPTPTDGNQYVDLSAGAVALKWTGSTNTTSYALYFGTDTANLTKKADIAYVTTPSYTVTGLADKTVYYWRIDASNSKGTTPGQVWSFRTSPVIPQGIVGAWTFDEALDNSITVLTDSTTYQNHGSLNQNADYTNVRIPGRVKNALDFSSASTNMYVASIPHQDQLFLDKSSLSISFWMKAPLSALPANATTSAYLLCKGSITRNAATGATGKRFDIEFKNSIVRFAVDDDINKDELQADAKPLFTDNWVHVVAIRDMTNKKLLLYKDGAAMTATSGSANANATKATGIGEPTSLVIGNIGELEFLANTNSASPYQGKIDELKIFNYVLSPAEIAALANPANSTLPITLTSFNASAEGRTSKITWSTATEQNADHFEVERSIDGRNFVVISSLKAKGINQQGQSYTTYDNTPYDGVNYYRLKQYDLDGKVVNQAIRTVNFNAGSIQLQAYPNPITNTSIIRFATNKPSNYTLAVYDMKGILIKVLETGKTEANKIVSRNLNANDFASGSYTIKLMTDDQLKTQQVFIQR